jgi:Flp pilus assembly protein TadB
MGGYEQSITDVIKSTIQDAQDLVRTEILLAKTELRQEVRRFGAGAAQLAAAAVAGLVAVMFLLGALAWAIPQLAGWPVWTGFAIVGAIMLIIAVVLAMMGKKQFNGERAMPLTLDTMKENMQWTRAQRS